MGYHSVNTAEIQRLIGSRLIFARVFCDETKKWTNKTFEYHEMKEALVWIEEQLNYLSM